MCGSWNLKKNRNVSQSSQNIDIEELTKPVRCPSILCWEVSMPILWYGTIWWNINWRICIARWLMEWCIITCRNRCHVRVRGCWMKHFNTNLIDYTMKVWKQKMGKNLIDFLALIDTRSKFLDCGISNLPKQEPSKSDLIDQCRFMFKPQKTFLSYVNFYLKNEWRTHKLTRKK